MTAHQPSDTEEDSAFSIDLGPFSFIAVAKTVVSTHLPTHGGITRLSWPG